MSQTIHISGQRKGHFWVALEEAEKGDSILYHMGEHCGGVHRADAAAAHAEGKVFLFCKRLGDGVFIYLAVKR